ncbi:MAG: hypothetical protein KAG84_01640 [Bacteroidales bacterium]|nr:hypothetical protein [Bacteroidales bacterium]
MKNKVIFIIIIAFALSLFSFKSNNSLGWKEYKNINGVSIFQNIADCTNQHNPTANSYFVFKYTNSNSYDVRISYKIEYWVGETCRTADLLSPNEYEISIDIAAGQTLEYSCSDNNKGFKLYKSSDSRNDDGLNRFEFTNIKVEKI